MFQSTWRGQLELQTASVVERYLGSQMREHRRQGQGGKRFLYASGRKHFAPLRSFDHLLIVLRTAIYVRSG
jgi:hypothetical protein